MNTLERRRIAKAQVIDVMIAKTAINQSRRERSDAAKALRKAMAANTSVSKSKSDAAFPLQAAG